MKRRLNLRLFFQLVELPVGTFEFKGVVAGFDR